MQVLVYKRLSLGSKSILVKVRKDEDLMMIDTLLCIKPDHNPSQTLK